MYKGASQGMQRALRVDKPMPTGGYIGSAQTEDHFIPSAANMSKEECASEKRQLLLEMTKHQNALLIAKRSGTDADVREIGSRIASSGSRISLINERLKEFRDADRAQMTWQAITEICSPEMRNEIGLRVNELMKNPP